MIEKLIASICDNVLLDLKKSTFSSVFFDDNGLLTVAGCLASSYISASICKTFFEVLGNIK